MSSSISAALGYVEVTATMKDGSSDVVRVREVSVRHMQRYATLLDNVAELVEFCCDRAKGWADKVDDDSLYALDIEVRKVNDPRLARYLERQSELAEWAEKKMPAHLASAISSLKSQ